MEIIYYLDLIGTGAFAIAGAFQGIKKQVNILGVLIAGILTAVGGGTIRDVLIFNTVPFWVNQTEYLWIAIIASTLTFFMPQHFAKNYHPYRFLDSMGLAVFMILGVSKALDANMTLIIAMISGILPSIGGGILRAISLGDLPPYVLRSGFYAAPAILGGILFLTLDYLAIERVANIFISAGFLLIIRLYGATKKWELPKISL